MMNDELETTWKEKIATYFKILSFGTHTQHSSLVAAISKFFLGGGAILDDDEEGIMDGEERYEKR
jgi:hypothetical protein